MKVVINTCFGGFSLSPEGLAKYNAASGKDVEYYFDIERDDPVLVELVEADPKGMQGKFAQLKVVEIPDNIAWYVKDYDGAEHVAERHRTWS